MPFVSHKIKLVQNGLLEHSLLKKEEARAFLDKTNSKKDLIWIGTIAELTPNKGLDYLIRAFSKIKNEAMLFIIGEGEEKDYLEKLVKNLELEDKVSFSGFIDKASKYLPAFDVFVLPSLKEGLPYVILEAGNSRVPVVASEIGNIRDIIPDEDFGKLVAPKDESGLTSAVNSLISDKKARNEKALRLKKRIVENFSFTEMLQKTLAIYRS